MDFIEAMKHVDNGQQVTISGPPESRGFFLSKCKSTGRLLSNDKDGPCDNFTMRLSAILCTDWKLYNPEKPKKERVFLTNIEVALALAHEKPIHFGYSTPNGVSDFFYVYSKKDNNLYAYHKNSGERMHSSFMLNGTLFDGTWMHYDEAPEEVPGSAIARTYFPPCRSWFEAVINRSYR